MKVLRMISRVILGLVFMFSGFVKAVDPLGSVYKFNDYFHAFHLEFLAFISLPLAILLCLAEFISGFSVLTGLKYKYGISGILLLLAVFTPLTLILAISNPVSDCGCFGDAIHLTNWQTFGKNIVLVIFLIIAFGNRNSVELNNKVSGWAIISGISALFVLFSLACLRYLPVIDFLPYSAGTRIEDKMKIPEGVEADKYNTTFVYEKDGTRKEFDLTNYPEGDSTWKFIEQKSVLVKKGYVPPIHDFLITGMDGEDLTQKILSYKGYTLLMISKKLKEAGPQKMNEGFKLGSSCVSDSIKFYILTSSVKDEIRTYEEGLTFCSADETTLKTMVRANPGYILLKDGVIIKKWSWANVPGPAWFAKLNDL